MEAKSRKRFSMCRLLNTRCSLKPFRNGRVHRPCRPAARFAAQHDFLHLKRVCPDNVEAVARRVWAGITSVEERQKHAAGL